MLPTRFTATLVAGALRRLVLGICTLLPAAALAQSSLLQPLLAAAERHYLLPQQVTLAELERDWPTQVAVVTGLVLRGQYRHGKREPAAGERYLQLQRDANAYLHELARRTGYVEGYSGQRISGEGLWEVCYQAMVGAFDEYAQREFGRGPLTEVDLLAGTDDERTPAAPPPPRARLFAEPPEQQINLLGERPVMPPAPAPGRPAQSPDELFSTQVVPLYNAHVDAWNAAVRAFESGNLAGSRRHFDRAHALCQQVRERSASTTHCFITFVDPDPDFPRARDQLGPFLTFWGPRQEHKRGYLRHWQARDCCAGCTPCL